MVSTSPGYLPAFEDRLPLVLKSLERFVPVLSVDDALIHFVLLFRARPRKGLQGGSDGDGPTLTNLLSQANGLCEGSPASGGE